MKTLIAIFLLSIFCKGQDSTFFFADTTIGFDPIWYEGEPPEVGTEVEIIRNRMEKIHKLTKALVSAGLIGDGEETGIEDSIRKHQLGTGRVELSNPDITLRLDTTHRNTALITIALSDSLIIFHPPYSGNKPDTLGKLTNPHKLEPQLSLIFFLAKELQRARLRYDALGEENSALKDYVIDLESEGEEELGH